jgi:hypothetical protein
MAGMKQDGQEFVAAVLFLCHYLWLQGNTCTVYVKLQILIPLAAARPACGSELNTAYKGASRNTFSTTLLDIVYDQTRRDVEAKLKTLVPYGLNIITGEISFSMKFLFFELELSQNGSAASLLVETVVLSPDINKRPCGGAASIWLPGGTGPHIQELG